MLKHSIWSVTVLLVIFCMYGSIGAKEPKSFPTKPYYLAWWEDDIAMDQTIIYSPLFHHLWALIRDDIVEEPVQLFRPVPFLDRLNATKVKREVFPPQSYLAEVFYGYRERNIIERIQSEQKKKIAAAVRPFSERIGDLDVLAYAGLGRDIQFPRNLFSYRKPIFFQMIEGSSFVKSFGLKYTNELGEEAMNKIRVVEYNHPDDFIIGFLLKAGEDEVFLAKIPPLTTFSKTMNYVKKRIDQDARMEFFLPGDFLHIPELNMNVQALVPELANNGVQNESKKSWFMSKIVQDYYLTLAVTGEAWNIQEQPFMTRNIHIKSMQLSSDRRYVLDKPFLLMLRRLGQQDPYLVVWVNDSEFMIKE